MPSALNMARAYSRQGRHYCDLAEQAAERDMPGQMGVFKFEAHRALNKAELACDVADGLALDKSAPTV